MVKSVEADNQFNNYCHKLMNVKVIQPSKNSKISF